MVVLGDQPVRSSLQVAPLSINKTGYGSEQASSTNLYPQAQMTPPTTPNGSQEDLNMTTESAPVFHNFLRAFHPFYPDHVPDSSVTLQLNQGDVVLVHSIHTNGWADGTLLVSGARGWLPTNYCTSYDPEEMRNLLKALLNFWDLLRSTSVSDSELFGNQDFMRGLIAGVRYLLERTHCLTRESAIIQRHEGLRRSRKSILSELSLLVKTAKRLQELQKAVDPSEDVNDVVDEMILRAFKIVTKGVRFLDLLEDDRRTRAPAVTVMATVLEEAYVPPTPPAETTAFEGHRAPSAASSRADEGAAAAEGNGSAAREATQTTAPANKRLSSVYSASANAHRLSQGNPLQVNRLSSTISHRMSLAGPSPLSRPHNLVSERLSSSHDTFLSHLGSFIGRLQVQSQSRPQLAVAVKQSASSGGRLLVVVDVVCAHSTISTDALNQYRAAMYDRLRELVITARDIITQSGSELEEVIVPQDNSRLLDAATGCVRATGECVAKTKWVIEKIGDFEFELENTDFSLTLDLDMSVFDAHVEREHASNAIESASIAESSVSEAPTTSTTVSTTSTASAPQSRPSTLSIDKPLPQVPQVSSPVEETFSLRPSSQLMDDGASVAASSISSLRPTLPPLPRISTSLLPSDDYSPTDTSATHEGDYSFRVDSMTATSSGSTSTYLSRDSESSLVSQTSTRATTPDVSHMPKNQRSLSELSSTGSAGHPEEDDLESKLLEKTYAHELIFNKEGQVVGGSLAALVERLTTHEATPDAMFVSTFYLTFRLFCTPLKLAEALIYRFDYVADAPHIANPVRLRTYNVFKGWLESHWREESDHEALALIRPFAEFKLGALLPSAGRRLLDLADKVSATNGTLVPRLVSSMGKTSTSNSQYIPPDTPLPAPAMTRSQTHALANWKAGGSPPSIMDFEPLEIARQLTIKQMAMFCSIMPDELLGSKWTKNGGVGSPNVKAMSTFTTGLSNLVADTILQHDEVKKRAAVIKHWIKIANQCLVLHNYDSVMAIACALDHTSIKRLRMTWDAVSAKRKEMLKALQSIIEFNQNHKVLRARLQDHVPPCLPFLGILLTDLTFIDVGNPATKTSDTGLVVINFDKHMRTAKCIGELQRFQIPYRLAEVPDLADWLDAQLLRVREKDQATNAQTTHYRKSLLLEPRETQQLRTPVDGTAAPGAAGNGMFSWMRSNSTSHTPGLTPPV
ncbi:ras GEF [Thozetella sp. PMI_491]|nr:ras GEF [Thozetella sp. PMI_491]